MINAISSLTHGRLSMTQSILIDKSSLKLNVVHSKWDDITPNIYCIVSNMPNSYIRYGSTTEYSIESEFTIYHNMFCTISGPLLMVFHLR